MNDSDFLGSNFSRMKVHNMRAILLYLLQHEPAYRVRIAKKVSLSTTTITNLVDELISLGIVAEEGIEVTNGRRRVGRPRLTLRLVKNARYAIGIDIGVGACRIAITSLKAEILSCKTIPFDRDLPSDDVFVQIAREVDLMIAENKIDRKQIIGAGIGTPGLVNYQTGYEVYSTRLCWQNTPIRDRFSQLLNLPVIVDNNVKTMALAEAIFGIGRNVSSLVFVYGQAGVGAGIVVGNRIFRGSDLAAGEIGHTIVKVENGLVCSCGKKGCLETLVTDQALIERAETLSQERPDSLLARTLHQIHPEKLATPVFLAAREGDPWALEIVNDAGYYLGIALTNLINVINPGMIILGGTFSKWKDFFIPKVKETVIQTTFARLGEKVQLHATSFEGQEGIVGAAALALVGFFYQNPGDF